MRFHGESGLGDATPAEVDVRDAVATRRELARQEIERRREEMRRNAFKIALVGVGLAAVVGFGWAWRANRRRRSAR